MKNSISETKSGCPHTHSSQVVQWTETMLSKLARKICRKWYSYLSNYGENSLFLSVIFDKLPVPENSKRNIVVWKPSKVWHHRCAASNSPMNGWRRRLPSWRESFLNPFAPLSALLYWYQTNMNNIANAISHLIFWYISGIKSYSLTLCQLNNKNVVAFVIGSLKCLNKDRIPVF